MRRAAILLTILAAAGPVWSQEVAEAAGAHLRLLDKQSGTVIDMTLADGASRSVGRLMVQLDDCRYPPDNPAADAFAHVTIRDSSAVQPLFQGWMVASSPALSALDHPRYDVWVLRCDVPDLVLPEVQPASDEEVLPEEDTIDDGNG